MDKKNWISQEVVGEDDLDAFETRIEKANAHVLDGYGLGTFPIRGLLPSTDGTFTVEVTGGIGLAVDADGDPRLVRFLASDDISLAGNVPPTPGDSRWILVGLHFTRLESDPQVDGENVTVMTSLAEDSELTLTIGAAAGSPAQPAVPVDTVPVCYVKISNGQTGIEDKHLDRAIARPTYGRPSSAGGVRQQITDISADTSNNCRVVAEEPATLKVRVRPGRVNYNGKSVVVAGGLTAAMVSPGGGNSRTYLVWVDDTGTIQINSGAIVGGGGSVAPSHVGRCVLAEVQLVGVTTEILQSAVTDVRPFVRAVRDTPNRYSFVAAGGETVITPPWSYIVGNNSLQVFDNGALQQGAGSYYTETDSATVTLAAGATAGHRITLMASFVADANPVSAHATNHAATGPDPIDYAGVNGLVLGLESFGTDAADDTKITVKPFAAIIDGRMRVSAANITTLTTLLAALNGATGPAASTWYYVYAYWDGAAILLEVSLTAPDTSRRIKLGDATRTYLFPLRSTSGSKIRAQRRIGRRTNYIIDYGNANLAQAMCGLALAAQAGDGNPHVVSAATTFPPHVTAGDFNIGQTGTAAVGEISTITGQSAQKTVHAFAYSGNLDALTQFHPLHVDLSNAQALQIQSANGATLYLWAIGYDD